MGPIKPIRPIKHNRIVFFIMYDMNCYLYINAFYLYLLSPEAHWTH